MTNIDVELSQEVAKEASKKINTAKKELEENKDSYNLFLRETVADLRKNLKKVLIGYIVTVFVFIIAMAVVGIYSEHLVKNMADKNAHQIKEMVDDNAQKMSDFMNQFDFYSEVEIMNELSDYNQNNLNITK